MMLYDGSPRCEVTLAIFWFLGFTLVLCWSIYSLPDGGGQATWVPAVFRRQSCLMVSFPPPRRICRLRNPLQPPIVLANKDPNQPLLCPIVFIIPSVFWPITLVLLTAKTIEGVFSRVAHRHVYKDSSDDARIPAMTQIHPKGESYALLHHSDEENCIGVDGGIPLDDLSDDTASPRSSMDVRDCDDGPLPYRPSRVAGPALSPSAAMGASSSSPPLGSPSSDTGSWGRKHFRPMPFHHPNQTSSAGSLRAMFGLRKVS
ncbi:hypothetical protein BD289DRAFT_12139 [Coniella lustricola]|uniref:Uncharacterized protein n=1 Tax=Coniella lustricola TaxID=2025994 RepID=A0A2T3A489_9PEZI|nr:hypothetical protein BD289DRAFT_12139 [Coniella lustricola]